MTIQTRVLSLRAHIVANVSIVSSASFSGNAAQERSLIPWAHSHDETAVVAGVDKSKDDNGQDNAREKQWENWTWGEQCCAWSSGSNPGVLRLGRPQCRAGLDGVGDGDANCSCARTAVHPRCAGGSAARRGRAASSPSSSSNVSPLRSPPLRHQSPETAGGRRPES